MKGSNTNSKNLVFRLLDAIEIQSMYVRVHTK